MGPLHLHRYRPVDHYAVWKLHNEELNAVGAHTGSGLWDQDLWQTEAVHLQNHGEFLGGILGERMVTIGALKHRTKDWAEIRHMRVHPEYWRRAMASCPFGARAPGRRLGYAVLQLDTTVYQKAARCLYEKNEFREVRRNQIREFACVFYEKSLAKPRPV